MHQRQQQGLVLLLVRQRLRMVMWRWTRIRSMSSTERLPRLAGVLLLAGRQAKALQQLRAAEEAHGRGPDVLA
jgi:transposase